MTGFDCDGNGWGNGRSACSHLRWRSGRRYRWSRCSDRGWLSCIGWRRRSNNRRKIGRRRNLTCFSITCKGDLNEHQVIDGAGPDRDNESCYTIGACGCVLHLCGAIGPEDGCHSGGVVDANRVALDGLREFAIDIFNAVATIEG